MRLIGGYDRSAMNYLLSFYESLPYAINLIFFGILITSLLVNFRGGSLLNNRFNKQFLNTSILVLLQLSFCLVLLKFFLTYKYINIWLSAYRTELLSPLVSVGYYGFFDNMYNNPFGDGLLVLCYIVSLVCLWYLGDRGIFITHAAVPYFSFFVLCTSVMTTTSNLLVMFISFELIFFPSLFFVYTLGYAKKTDKTIWFLLTWTLLGAFIVLFAFAKLYTITGTFDFKTMLFGNFSDSEHNFLYLLFFIGFGIKIPVFPFHYWLTKVHVEAPAGFSMFLSGFLVKTALYCFYFVHLIFNTHFMQFVIIIWVSIGIIEASIKMWTQVDIKKLVAFATIQEMNMLLLCLLLTQAINIHILIIFTVLHGLLSTLMFFIVDQVQKRAGTRDILELQGALHNYPWLRGAVWVMLIQFLGLPLTSKFIVEWYLGALLITSLGIYGCLIFFIAMFFGSVGFFKCWALILYGTPQISTQIGSDLNLKDLFIVFFLLFLLFLLNFCIVLV